LGGKKQRRENTETQRLKIIMDITSVADRHLFDADPDPTFHFDADSRSGSGLNKIINK
jgi:hypothetical protein